jgi:hypothetical protein
MLINAIARVENPVGVSAHEGVVRTTCYKLPERLKCNEEGGKHTPANDFNELHGYCELKGTNIDLIKKWSNLTNAEQCDNWYAMLITGGAVKDYHNLEEYMSYNISSVLAADNATQDKSIKTSGIVSYNISNQICLDDWLNEPSGGDVAKSFTR